MHKYAGYMTINISIPENTKPIRSVKSQQTKKLMTDEKVDASIALAGLQSALAEVTILKMALANSEHDLKAARDLIVIFRDKARMRKIEALK